MEYCTICPNKCKADRDKTKGQCGVGNDIVIAKYYLHPYEEPCLSGEKGSGTVFFAGCSLRCVFCQNYEVSHECIGKQYTVKDLAEIFKRLDDMGAANINLVSPTQYSKKIIEALKFYKPKVPVVWNTHGYETIENLEIIDPYVDIYLTDLKFYSEKRSLRYAKKADYFKYASEAAKFMLKRKKPKFDGDKMLSGVIVRHLVLPENLDETFKILEFLAPIVGDNYLSVMAQYTPYGEAENYPELKRAITEREYSAALNKVYELGFKNVYTQSTASCGKTFIPKWGQE